MHTNISQVKRQPLPFRNPANTPTILSGATEVAVLFFSGNIYHSADQH